MLAAATFRRGRRLYKLELCLLAGRPLHDDDAGVVLQLVDLVFEDVTHEAVLPAIWPVTGSGADRGTGCGCDMRTAPGPVDGRGSPAPRRAFGGPLPRGG